MKSQDARDEFAGTKTRTNSWENVNVEANLTGVQEKQIKAGVPAWDKGQFFAKPMEGHMEEKEIGKITHYYGHLSVGIIELSDALKVGETIHIKGHSSDFSQVVDSMQVEHASVTFASPGDVIGIKITDKAHPHDKIYKVIG